MSSVIYIFYFIALHSFNTNAIECDACRPLAEVSITNKGLEKIIEVSMAENLKRFNETVKSRAGFENITIDKSKCKTQTIGAAWKKDFKGSNCFGLPELSDDFVTDTNTIIRPYRADIDQFKLNQINLALTGPVRCQKFKCDFDIQIKDMSIDGRLQLTYTSQHSDKPKGFIPPTDFNISTTEQANMKFSGQVFIDPSTGQINDLVFLSQKKSKINLSSGSLHLNMKLNKPFESKQAEIKMRGKAFRRFIDFKEKPDLSLIDAPVRKDIIKIYGSEAKFLKTLQKIKWPDINDDMAIDQFINNMPSEVIYFPKFIRRLNHVDLASNAENAGFSNYQSYMVMNLANNLTNMAVADPVIVENIIVPSLQEEVVPAIQSDVNSELRNLKQYWDQISRAPTLNMNELEKVYELQKKLFNTVDETEKAKIRREIIERTKKNEETWISIDTQVLVDQNTRQGQLLKAQIFQSSKKCSDLPKNFSDDADTDFDLRTEIGPESLQHYLNELAANNKLNLCMDSFDQKKCSGGTKINFKTPPKVSCDNGDFAMELDVEAAKGIFNADITGKVRAKIQNCGGDPCLQFHDSKGRFRNIILNTFFGGFLQRGLRSALNKSSNVPMNIPFVKLQKLQTSPKDCKTKLDWEIRP